MKKSLSVFLAVAFSLMACTGCKQSAGNEQSSIAQNASSEKITLTYMASQDWVKDTEMDLAKEFEQETGIAIDFQIMPNDQYINALKTKLKSGECTDLFGNQSGKFDLESSFDIENNAVDLSNEEWVSRLDPLTAEQSSVNGKLYGLTLFDVSQQWVIVYNKTIFDQLNLTVPSSFDEFKQACATISNAGITPIYECMGDGWHQFLWFPELGGAIGNSEPDLIENLNTNQVKFTDVAAAQQALDQVNELVQLGYMGEDYLSNTFPETEQAMASGNYAMTINNLAEPDNIASQYSEVKAEDYGFFPNPLLDNQYQNVNPAGPTHFIWSGSKNIEAAKQYLDFLARPENLQRMIDNEPKFSTLPFTGVKDKYSADARTYFEKYPKQETVLQTNVKYLVSFGMDIAKDMTALFTDQMTSQQMLEHLDSLRAQQAQAAGDTNWN